MFEVYLNLVSCEAFTFAANQSPEIKDKGISHNIKERGRVEGIPDVRDLITLITLMTRRRIAMSKGN